MTSVTEAAATHKSEAGAWLNAIASVQRAKEKLLTRKMKRGLVLLIAAICVIPVLVGCHNETDEPSQPMPPGHAVAPVAGSSDAGGSLTVSGQPNTNSAPSSQGGGQPSASPMSGYQGGNSAAPYQVGGGSGASPPMSYPSPAAPVSGSPSTGGQPPRPAGPAPTATVATPTTD